MEKINYRDLVDLHRTINESISDSGALMIVSPCKQKVIGKTAAAFINLIMDSINKNGKFGFFGKLLITGKIIMIIVDLIKENKNCI